MLKSEFVEIKVNSGKKSYYKSLGYNVSDDTIKVRINDLPKSSRALVKVDCDYCYNEKSVLYYEYLRNTSFNGKFSCSNKCGSLKKKELSLIKYGTESPSNLDYIKEKNKKTNLEKYGVEWTMQSKEIQEKSKIKNLDKYGFEYASQSDIIKEKIKDTNLEKYGVENPFQSNDIKEKTKETNLEKYGVEHISQSTIYKDKVKKTNLKRWGFEHAQQSDIIKEKTKLTNFNRYGGFTFQSNLLKEKAKKTILEKYGVDHITQSEDIRKKFNICKDSNYLKYIGNNVSVFKCELGHDFEITSDNYHSRKKLNTPLCTVCYPINDSKSIKEEELYNYIKSIYSGEFIQSYRDGLEIDIYLPELGIGFEFNGLYWHSEEYKSKNYHLDKQKYFKERGIRIIYIWEDDWDFKRDIIKSQIFNLIGKSNRIFARNCFIKLIDNKMSSKFLNENHLQGNDHSSIKIGLIHENNLVSLMTFNKLEGRKNLPDGEWNLSRFCNLLNINVIGGASKLLNYFIKTYSPIRITSYADKDWSMGNLYLNLGFENINETKPDYKYIIDGIRKHKSNFKKSKLKLDENITENEFMKSKGYHKIWDCGKIKFEKIIKRNDR